MARQATTISSSISGFGSSTLMGQPSARLLQTGRKNGKKKKKKKEQKL